MARLRASWRTSLPVAQQPRNPQSESIARTPYHTAEVAGYVVEGHVPAGAIKRLLAERPDAKGLAVPGMPVGSPGMDVEGTAPETYEVILFDPAGQRPFARYRGSQEA